MARAILVRRTWHGDEFLVRGRRASARAVVGMGERAAASMSRSAHRISGNLSRSTHAARVETMGAIEATQATVSVGDDRFKVEAGSWLPYACVENNRGGEHRFADIGWDAARPAFPKQLKRAWREEGL